MKMELTVLNIGESVGCVGWLAKNAGGIKIVNAKNGRRLAILCDKSGGRICFLTRRVCAGEDYPDQPSGWRDVRNGVGGEYYTYTGEQERFPGLVFTLAAWAAMEKIIELARAELVREETEEPVPLVGLVLTS